MGKKEYMEILLSQIRNDKAKELVGQEIEAHIDDQAEVYMEFGVDADTAEKKAVRSMGDPVETGVSLDRIHKPKMSWSMIILVAILSVLGLTIQGVSWVQAGEMFFFERQVAYVIIGFVCMLVICMIDYSRIVQHGKLLAVIYLGISVLFCVNSHYYNGALFISLGAFSISWHFVLYLSLPLFGILLYHFRKQSKRSLLIPVGFMVLVILIFWQRKYSTVVLANLIFMAGFVLTYAIAKGWYPVKVKRFIGILWSCLIGIPLVSGGLILSRLLNVRTYVSERLLYFFTGNEQHALYGSWRPIQEILTEVSWLGGVSQMNTHMTDVNGVLSDYVLLHVAASYGVLLLIVIIVLLAFFCCQMFHMSIKQKNQAGTMIGISCGLIFTVQIAEYVLMNLGLIPGTTVFLPLFSYGGSGTVISFILIGLLLSIYRYQNLVTERKAKKRIVVKLIDV
ncbi:MAG: FtsW/RodA/SpoVE family cell cycle protein [Eubacterium sp.]|nr:FtsW/RodA/SpoVE family cell cycle protein [Eubacterium sp.]